MNLGPDTAVRRDIRVDPVFTGGSGRSGTTLVGRLIGAHSRYALVPIELRFHADKWGLSGLLDGRLEFDQALERLNEHWFLRLRADGRPRGLYQLVPRERYEAAVAEFRRAFDADPAAACNALVRGMVDGLLAETGKASWVETTPRNVLSARALYRMFPSMKLVHVVRDGRDVARSAMRVGAFPDLEQGLRWWERVLRRADREARALPGDRLLILQMEDLVAYNRDATYHRLLDFLELEDEPGVGTFFNHRISGDHAHVGQWATDLDGEAAEQVRRQYRQILDRLASEGVCGAPSPESI